MWEALPQYLAIGMTEEGFWHGPARLCKAYRDAWLLRCDNRYTGEWRQGLYVMKAVEVALDGAFNGEKAQSAYPDAPLWSTEATRREVEERREREAAEARRQRVEAWAARVNGQFARAASGDGVPSGGGGGPDLPSGD